MNYTKKEFKILPINTLLLYQTGELDEIEMNRVHQIIQSDLKTYGSILDGLDEMLLIYGRNIEGEFNKIQSISDLDEWAEEAKMEYATLQKEKEEIDAQPKEALGNFRVKVKQETNIKSTEKSKDVSSCIPCLNNYHEIEDCKKRLSDIENKFEFLYPLKNKYNAIFHISSLLRILSSRRYWTEFFRKDKNSLSQIRKENEEDQNWMDDKFGGRNRMVPIRSNLYENYSSVR